MCRARTSANIEAMTVLPVVVPARMLAPAAVDFKHHRQTNARLWGGSRSVGKPDPRQHRLETRLLADRVEDRIPQQLRRGAAAVAREILQCGERALAIAQRRQEQRADDG